MLKSLPLFIIALVAFSCGTSEEMTNTREKKPQDSDKFIVSGLIVEKDFIKKNGESAGFTELYFRASVQDYFIKFCESNVTRKDLEPFIDQGVTVHAEIIDGNWDICPGDPQEMQSRIGNYMIVKELK